MGGQSHGRQPYGRRGTATHPQGNLIVHSQLKRNQCAIVGSENLGVCVDEQVVVGGAAGFRVAATCFDDELLGPLGVDVKVELQRRKWTWIICERAPVHAGRTRKMLLL